MNKAVKAMYPDINFYESPNGVPVMECGRLPEGARRIEFSEELSRRIMEDCVHVNEMGMHVPDYGKALPVFIRSMELRGRDVRHFFRVNYVSPSEASMKKAAGYIAEGKLYAVM